MHIQIRNKIITTPVEQILDQAQKELQNGKLRHIDKRNKVNILISCPVHSDGLESNPSCRIFTATDNPTLEAGYAHCFSCGYHGTISETITALFDEIDPKFGEDWLIERFCDTFVEYEVHLPEIVLDQSYKKKYLNEDILKKYDFYHPYMWKRKLSKEIVDKFRVGYDMERKAITFPVYDEKHRLVMVTARSVENKRFYIPSETEKPVYLLYDIMERGVTTVLVAESQINALYARSLGYDSIGLFGTGSKTQLQTLKRSGIRNYILAFDGDSAGRKGAARFKAAMGSSVFITDLILPKGKDLNDLSPEEIKTLIDNS